jgi:polar amino acid transport system substrate-binding protein
MRHSRQSGRRAIAVALGAALAAAGAAQAETRHQDGQPLRFCADPDNLPFSQAGPDPPGLYIEMGQHIARALGRPFETVWAQSYFGKRTMRTTLLAKACDAYVGLPGGKGFMGPQMVFSTPFLQIGYAILAPPGKRVTQLASLAGERVAVQFATPPQFALASRDDMRGVTFLNPATAARAVANREVDAAFIWGPMAGYINARSLHGTYQVIPVAGTGMQWPVVIGFAKANAALRDQVNEVLDQSLATVTALAVKYGLPSAPPIQLTDRDEPRSPRLTLAADSETEQRPAEPPKTETGALPKSEAAAPVEASKTETAAPPAGSPAPAVAEAASSDQVVAEGHVIFNGTCSHCHGPDGVQSVRKIDLRLLRHRYGDTTETVFHDTVTKGRPSKGMPSWSKVFSEEDFMKIFAFLSTIQTD